jgi:hypothetical protein
MHVGHGENRSHWGNSKVQVLSIGRGIAVLGELFPVGYTIRHRNKKHSILARIIGARSFLLVNEECPSCFVFGTNTSATNVVSRMAVLLGGSQSTRRNGAKFFGSLRPAVLDVLCEPSTPMSPSEPITAVPAHSESWALESGIHLLQTMRDLGFSSLSEGRALFSGTLPFDEAKAALEREMAPRSWAAIVSYVGRFRRDHPRVDTAGALACFTAARRSGSPSSSGMHCPRSSPR